MQLLSNIHLELGIAEILSGLRVPADSEDAREVAELVERVRAVVNPKSVSGIYFPTETSFHICWLCPRRDRPGRGAPYEEHLWAERYAER
jgi:hypothetical protein